MRTLFSAEDVKMVIHNSIGFVNLDRCAEIAMKLGDERSLKFTVIADLAVRCKSFRNLRRDSLNKVLTRTLRYLTDAGVPDKHMGRKERKVKSMYFRLYRIHDSSSCIGCRILRELEKLLERLKPSLQ